MRFFEIHRPNPRARTKVLLGQLKHPSRSTVLNDSVDRPQRLGRPPRATRLTDAHPSVDRNHRPGQPSAIIRSTEFVRRPLSIRQAPWVLAICSSATVTKSHEKSTLFAAASHEANVFRALAFGHDCKWKYRVRQTFAASSHTAFSCHFVRFSCPAASPRPEG